MKFMKTMMFVASLMLIETTSFCYGRGRNSQNSQKVTFKNSSGMTVSLTGPRGTRSLQNGGSMSIPPKTNPVSYTIAASGYPTYSGSATAGKSYTITVQNNQITVN
ncbi:MAG: hypothetical protein JO129_01350 [Candidatus Dependentiae bacterium]|nr:hypothetical protein [Candidatus Dependentiae bacterium]